MASELNWLILLENCIDFTDSYPELTFDRLLARARTVGARLVSVQAISDSLEELFMNGEVKNDETMQVEETHAVSS